MKLTVRAALFAALVFMLSAVAVAWQARADAALDTLFPGSKALASQNWNVKAAGVVQWKQMLDRFQKQQANCEPADGCGKFKTLVASLNGLSTHDQLKTVLRAEHSIVYTEDMAAYGKTEFWATPYETLSTNTGDTEDYAILSYLALRAAGMPKEAMHVMAVRLQSQGGVGHDLLAVDTTPGPMILDNRSPMAMPANLVAKEFKPVLGFNEDGWWFYTAMAQ